jgi:hypothetical protein
VSDNRHTVFAQQALGLAELFQGAFSGKPVGTAVTYRAELSSPEGPSTGGGTQALQPIKLTPIQTGTTLVVGHANQVEKTAELRTYEYLVRWQQQRFKGVGELALERAAYDELFARLKTFFAGQGLRVTIVAAPPNAEVAAAPPSTSSNTMIIAVGVLLGIAVLVGLVFWLRH